MTTPFPTSRRLAGGFVASAIALALSSISALAQGPAGPPPGAPGAPPGDGQIRLPPGAANGPPAGGPPPVILSPAQKLVASLPPPGAGGLPPRAPLPANAVLPNADPHDFQGTWYNNQPLQFRMQKDIYGGLAPYNMDGAMVIARRVNSLKDGKPFINASAICRPPGPQWQRDLNFPFMIVQNKDYVEFIFEEYHGRWYISLDPQRMPLPAEKQYTGRSVGHWDGNTLVVETSDFKQAIWLDVDGTPLSAQGKLIQRIRKVSEGGQLPYLEIVTTIVDPANYAATWSVARSFGWIPHQAVFAEYNCEEQVGDPSVNADAGLVAEPKD